MSLLHNLQFVSLGIQNRIKTSFIKEFLSLHRKLLPCIADSFSEINYGCFLIWWILQSKWNSSSVKLTYSNEFWWRNTFFPKTYHNPKQFLFISAFYTEWKKKTFQISFKKWNFFINFNLEVGTKKSTRTFLTIFVHLQRNK